MQLKMYIVFGTRCVCVKEPLAQKRLSKGFMGVLDCILRAWLKRGTLPFLSAQILYTYSLEPEHTRHTLSILSKGFGWILYALCTSEKVILYHPPCKYCCLLICLLWLGEVNLFQLKVSCTNHNCDLCHNCVTIVSQLWQITIQILFILNKKQEHPNIFFLSCIMFVLSHKVQNMQSSEKCIA